MSQENEVIRLTPDQRKVMIVNAALEVSKEKGLFNWTRKDVAAACAFKTSDETVKRYFKYQDSLRKAVAEHPDATDEIKKAARAVSLIA